MTGRRLLLTSILMMCGLLPFAEPVRAALPSMILDIYDRDVDTDYEAGVAGELLSLGRVALVRIQEPSSGTELWVTDGTDAGTRPLFDRCAGNCSTSLFLLGALDNVGLFATSESGGSLLWRTDGTRPGTSVVASRRRLCTQAVARAGRTLLLSTADDSPENAPASCGRPTGPRPGPCGCCRSTRSPA